jgi:hypothetical protein
MGIKTSSMLYFISSVFRIFSGIIQFTTETDTSDGNGAPTYLAIKVIRYFPMISLITAVSLTGCCVLVGCMCWRAFPRTWRGLLALFLVAVGFSLLLASLVYGWLTFGTM